MDFIKIDVEGYEENVIKGGQNLLARDKPIVVLELNHFCLNVFRRITVPDFFDFLRTIFPYVYAVDRDNRLILDINNPENAYQVMYEHIVKNRFSNLVAGYDSSLSGVLENLSSNSDLTLYPDTCVDHKSSRLEWSGFSDAEEDFRWTDGRSASISFYWLRNCLNTGIIRLLLNTFGEQHITVYLNMTELLFEGVLNGNNQ